MAPSKQLSVSEYIQNQEKPQQKLLFELRSIILSVVPEAEELINYGIPAITLVKGGKRDQQFMIAGFKNHVGLYPHPETIVAFTNQLKDYKQGKGSIQFPLDKPLPKKLIEDMVSFRLKQITKNL